MSIDIETLQSKFSGEIIKPGDSQYEHASTVLMAKGSPALVVRPKNTADVVLAVQYAADNALLLSVRSGGHSGPGLSTNNGGLVIDLKYLNTVEVTDPVRHVVRIGGGALWGDIAQELQKHQLALSSGDTKSVGVGGLTLGAGVGWMVRKYGLAIDSLVAAEVVTADGQVVRASDTEHSDLFWAIRGGGGNFGVVTSFEFVAHPTGKVYAGSIMYPPENYAALLKGWRDCMRAAPEELTTMFLVMPSFAGMPPAAIALCCYAGDNKDAAMKAIDPLLHIGTVTHQDVVEKDYCAVLEDAHVPEGVKVIVNNTFVEDLSDELLEIIAKNPDKIFQIRSTSGAMNRIATDATAFAHRSSEALIVSPVFVAPDASEQDADAATAYWREILPHGKGAYINFFNQATEKEAAACYPPATYERLAKIKAVYDPGNIFNQNINIKPA
ncbi:MAG TPA: FAD-binding oxidoreductase [Patescibacteria group bacterium]|nr:FAD-binding oxidoreductase [Patescibacteria group bacterium]